MEFLRPRPEASVSTARPLFPRGVPLVRRVLRIVPVLILSAGLTTCSLFRPHHGPAEFGGGYDHLSQGSELFPYDIFTMIEQPDSDRMFTDNLERYGLIPDAQDEVENPLGLPIGLSVAQNKGAPLRGVGMTCSACHSGQIEYNGRKRLIPGAPGMFNPDSFFYDLASATEQTLQEPAKRHRFLKRYFERKLKLDDLPFSAFENEVAMAAAGEFERLVIDHVDKIIDDEIRRIDEHLERDRDSGRFDVMNGRADELEEAAEADSPSRRLKADPRLKAARKVAPLLLANAPEDYDRPSNRKLGGALDDFAADLRILITSLRFIENYASVRNRATSLPGHGRVDAFGKVRNQVLPLAFGKVVERPTTAPVSFPHIWGTRPIRWLHWNGNTDSVMQRNVLEALGSGAMVELERYETTVNFDNLYELEAMTHDFKAPVWPEDLLPPIDAARAEKGRTIFYATDPQYADTSRGNCVQCHTLRQPDPGARLVEYRQRSLAEIGTDPNHATNFNHLLDGGNGEFDKTIAGIAEKILSRHYEDKDVSEEEQDRWEDWRRPVIWRSPIETPLPQRPLQGIWATAPFLHNGSVPTLYDLLLPVADRPKTFTTGSFRFDPERVGFELQAADAKFVFKVDAPVVDGGGTTYPEIANGNSNGGHEFGTALNDEDRWALVEYLKTL